MKKIVSKYALLSGGLSIVPSFENRVDPDQLATDEAS